MALLFRRGRGHIPNRINRRPRSVLEHPMLGGPLRTGEALNLPLAVDLSNVAPPVMDQGGSGSCEGHAEAGALATTLAAAGAPLDFVPSPDWIYRVGRALMRVALGQSVHEPLTDSGLEPVFADQAAADWGVVEMVAPSSDGRWSDVEEDVKILNAEPDFAKLRESAHTLIRGSHRVDLIRAERYAAMQASLATGRALKSALNADGWDFQGYEGGVLMATQNPGSDHAVYLVGYRYDDTQRRIWKGTNSWGTSWGLEGHFECDDSFVDWMTDIEVVDAQSAQIVGGP